MSQIISELESSLTESNSKGLLSGSSVLLEADSHQTHLLNLACFGRTIPTSQNDKQWFQFGLEEAFFLFHSLKCLQILTAEEGRAKSEQEIWNYMCSKLQPFPQIYKAYSHLRMKNWVVRPGSQYGVDYVAYRHHPALVHSEFAVLVFSDDESASGRLRVWSDFHCTLRLCGSVAKTLLAIKIQRDNNRHGAVFPACLDEFSVTETTVTRWNPERSREEKTDAKCVKITHKLSET